MTVSELARRGGTAVTVRHYTRSGLLAPIRDESSSYF
jgi:DNA-binding transcriptional MerR regulator